MNVVSDRINSYKTVEILTFKCTHNSCKLILPMYLTIPLKSCKHIVGFIMLWNIKSFITYQLNDAVTEWWADFIIYKFVMKEKNHILWSSATSRYCTHLELEKEISVLILCDATLGTHCKLVHFDALTPIFWVTILSCKIARFVG